MSNPFSWLKRKGEQLIAEFVGFLDQNDDGTIDTHDIPRLLVRLESIVTLVESLGSIIKAGGGQKLTMANQLLDDAIGGWIGQRVIHNPARFKEHKDGFISNFVGMLNSVSDSDDAEDAKRADTEAGVAGSEQGG